MSSTLLIASVILLTVCWTGVGATDLRPSSTVNYSRYRVIRLLVTTRQQMEIVQLAEEDLRKGIDVWKESAKGNVSLVDLLVAPGVYENLTSRLNKADIEYIVMFDDLQRVIDEQKAAEELTHRLAAVAAARNRRRRRTRSSSAANRSFNSSTPADDDLTKDSEVNEIVGKYVNHSDINRWLRTLHRKRPEIVSVIEIGMSYENRQLLVIKISEPSSTNVEKPAIWIDAGIHAREWIAPATAVFIIKSLVTGYRTDPDVTSLIHDYDWYIFPMINPDGYSYSRTVDRMWRKTRSRIILGNRSCFGVDGNRNFDYQWLNECKNLATSSRCRGRQPCDNVFAGFQPLSEPETIAVANFIHNHRSAIKMYITLHSYSQLWLTPWGYTANAPPDNDDMMRVGLKGVEALRQVHNTQYEIGSPALILYAATGGSYDWAKGKAGIKYSYTIELRDVGRYGFLLPASQIEPTGEETWAGIMAAVNEMSRDVCWVTGEGCNNTVVENRISENSTS